MLILLALVFIKSFGDNSIDLTQISTALLDKLNIIFTCDFTLFLSAMSSGGMAVLTTNAPDPSKPGRTGNLSTLFCNRVVTAEEELRSIFDSCRSVNVAYLDMLKQEYLENTVSKTVRIKLGGEFKYIHLWFLFIIIKAIETCMENHNRILQIFIDFANHLVDNVWVEHKDNILSLLKSYCKIDA